MFILVSFVKFVECVEFYGVVYVTILELTYATL